MSFSFDDTKERVKEAVDIVDLVGKYLQLRRSGRGYAALCPWHDDTKPSLQVNPERQSFKCWVCDIGGDVFTFIMKIEGVEFREALALLADQAGIALKPSRPPRGGQDRQTGQPGRIGQQGVEGRYSEEGYLGHDNQSWDPELGTASTQESTAPPRTPNKRTLYQAMAWAEQKYHECLLNSPEAEPARKYLESRGITEASLVKFHLGFSPNRGDWLLRLAQKAKANTPVLETVGILAESQRGGSPYDRFHGRLLFPIRDPQDRPIAFGGRVLPESGSTSPAKYVNSPETPLFRKSKRLYGLDLARHALRKNRTVVVMEGYTDCIVAHQHGFEHAVAVLGTALGEGHLRALGPFADRIVLVLDGDEAGQRRANEVLALFVAEQVDLRIVTLPEGLDPADFLAEHGSEAFDDLLTTRAVDALEHAFLAKTNGLDLQHDLHGATRALEELVSIVAQGPRLREGTTRESRLREEKVLEQLAFKFRVPEQDVRNRLTALRRKAARRPARHRVDPSPDEPPTETDTSGPIDPWHRELLEILVRYPRCLTVAREAIPADTLAHATCRRIYQGICRLADRGEEPTFDRLMLEFDEAAVKSLLVELDESVSAKGIHDPEALLRELIHSFQIHEARKQAPVQTGTLRDGQIEGSEALDLLNEIIRQKQTLEKQGPHGFAEPTDG